MSPGPWRFSTERSPEVRTFKDRKAWIESAAELIFTTVLERVGAQGLAALALAGGKTPQPVYERLSRDPYRKELPWKAIHFFWGDERCVPVEDPASNYGMARQALFNHVPVPVDNLHPIPVQRRNGPEAAARYEEALRLFFQKGSLRPDPRLRDREGRVPPEFDLILLGLGRDGHTASLFPGDPALEEKKRWAIFIPDSPLPPQVPRVTLTLPVINRARIVLFLVSGGGKKDIMEIITKEREKPNSPYPAALVRPSGQLIWMILQNAQPFLE